MVLEGGISGVIRFGDSTRKTNFLIKGAPSWLWQHTPINPSTKETETVGPLAVQGQPALQHRVPDQPRVQYEALSQKNIKGGDKPFSPSTREAEAGRSW